MESARQKIKRISSRVFNQGNKRWTISLLYRIIPLSLLAIVPAVIVFNMLYSDVRNHYIQESVSSLSAQTSFSKETLELELNNIRSQAFEFWVDRDVLQLATGSSILDGIEIVERIRRIQNRLLALERSSDLIVGTSIMFVDGARKISSSGVDNIDAAIIEEERIKLNSQVRDLYFTESGLRIIQSYPSLLSERTKAQAILIIEIPIEQLRSHLGYQLFSDTDVLYLADSAGEPMTESIVGNIESHELSDEIVQMLGRPIEEEGSFRTYAGANYILAAAYSPMLQSWLVKKTAFSEAFTTAAFSGDAIIIFIVITILVISISFMVLFYFFFRPLKRLYAAFGQLGQGGFGAQIDHNPKDSFALIYKGFNNMSQELEDLVSKVYGQQILTQKAEMKHLQAQINPHFLYNSLFMLKTLLQIRNYDLAIEALDHLALYYRFLARDGRSEIILAEEVSHARVYTEIQRLRNAGRIDIFFDELPEEVHNYVVPRLILQPLIENAFEHGLKDVEEDGLLRVGFAVADEYLEIHIENNGTLLSEDELHALNDYVATEGKREITGLQNILSRIKRYFGEDCALVFTITDELFLRVTLQLSLHRLQVIGADQEETEEN